MNITSFIPTTPYIHLGFVDWINTMLLELPIAPWVVILALSIFIGWWLITKSLISRAVLIGIFTALIFTVLRFVLGLGL